MIEGLLAIGCWLTEKHLVLIAVIGAACVLFSTGRRSNRRCSRCRQVNREEAVFCAQCGRRLSDR